MIPVCEDQGLVELSDKSTTSDLLCISSVCGVSILAVPIAGDVNPLKLTAFLLDITGLAER